MVSRALLRISRSAAYVISEIEVTNADGYTKEYVPLATKALVASGQKRLASGGRTISLSGLPPASRVALSTFDRLEKAQAAYTSPACAPFAALVQWNAREAGGKSAFDCDPQQTAVALFQADQLRGAETRACSAD